MKPAPLYSFGKPRTGRQSPSSKLTKWDVKEIRTWATTDGYGLSLSQKIRCLQQSYPLAFETLNDVLQNKSWYDPTYDYTKPTAPATVESFLFSPFAIFLLLLWQLTSGQVIRVPAPADATNHVV